MGFGSSAKRFFRRTGKWFQNAGRDVYKTGKTVVNTVYSDVKAVVKFEGEIQKRLTEAGAKLAEGISTSIPWIVGGVVAVGGAYFYMTSNKRSGQFSRDYGGKRSRFTYDFGLGSNMEM